jgi:antitoxin component HigA of HigAB toxin-antitoxin module
MYNTILLIKSEHDYDAALLRIQTLIRAQVVNGTPEFEELGLLLDAVECYEQEHYPI